MARKTFQFEQRDTVMSLADLKRMPYAPDLNHLYKSLIELLGGDQRHKLDKNGYVIALDGAYGAGKTTATNALVGELQTALGTEQVFYIDRSFLPFSNPTEAITTFLNMFAERLWRRGFVDIRRDIQQFILEVTPTTERPRAGVSVGPFTMSWPVGATRRSADSVDDVISQRLDKLVRVGRTIILMLDDLDRLEPDQIVAIMRMVEKLRALPRVVIILPVYKSVIARAFSDQLKVDNSESSALLRKLIDYEIKIRNRRSDMERIFREKLNSSGRSNFAPWVAELCWHILLHNIIITEAHSKVAQDHGGGREKLEIIWQSPYLTQLHGIIRNHVRHIHGGVDPYLSHYRESGARDFFAPLGMHYGGLDNMDDDFLAPKQLAEMRNLDNVMKLITAEPSVVEVYQRGENYITFDHEKQARMSKPALTEFFIPMLKTSGDEPFLTDNYKLRDMAILARNIRNNPKFNASLDDLGKLYTLIRQEYDDFR